jgi:hypothetical protein
MEARSIMWSYNASLNKLKKRITQQIKHVHLHIGNYTPRKQFWLPYTRSCNKGMKLFFSCLVKNDRTASPGQGHRLRRLLSEQVAHNGCGSRVTDNPNWFQASKYSILHSSLSSAESRYHCLVIHKMKADLHTNIRYWTLPRISVICRKR